MEFQKAEKNSYRGEHSKQLKEARAGIQAAVKVLEQVEILSLEFFFENSVARQEDSEWPLPFEPSMQNRCIGNGGSPTLKSTPTIVLAY